MANVRPHSSLVTVDPSVTSDGGRDGLIAQRRPDAAHVDGREARPSHDVDFLVACAHLRDLLAEARDRTADQRDMAANLDAFIHGRNDPETFEARQLARQERRYSRLDRLAAEQDRTELVQRYEDLRMDGRQRGLEV